MPNITPHTHASDCWRLTTSTNQPWWGQPGDVKRCPHGKLMIRMQVSIHSRVAGPGTDYWRTLSPIFDPIKYQLARKALA